MRLKSVKNIQKITKSMKMVSAAKFARDERQLRAARPYGNGAKAFYEKADVKVEAKVEETGGAAPVNHILLAIASDRGLCGAANSSISKAIRNWLAENPEKAKTSKIVAVGDKARSQLQRQHSDNILMHFADVGRSPATFQNASHVAQKLVSSDFNFDFATMYYNVFKSVISYQTSAQALFSQDIVAASPKLALYDSIDEDVITSYNEFTLTSLIFYALKENATSEQSSRMTAMESATKNAGEMIDKLTLTYNRTRQAVITRELIEIISGAAAV